MKQILIIPAILATVTLKAIPLPVTLPAQVYNITGESIQVPLGGNTWAFGAAERRQITGNGIERWSNKDVYFITYVRINTPGSMVVKLKASNSAGSKLTMTIAGKKKTVSVKPGNNQWFSAGEWQVKDTGYIAIRLEGVSKKGEEFAAVSDYEISGTAINHATAYVKNNEGNFFLLGPSRAICAFELSVRG